MLRVCFPEVVLQLPENGLNTPTELFHQTGAIVKLYVPTGIAPPALTEHVGAAGVAPFMKREYGLPMSVITLAIWIPMLLPPDGCGLRLPSIIEVAIPPIVMSLLIPELVWM